jgi:adenylate cyclase class 2
MSTQNDIETEVKIAVPHWAAAEAARHLAAINLTVTAPRVFEANFVYDTPEQSVRGSQMLLRLRRVGPRNILTWKGPYETGPYKSRPELELQFESFETMHQILGHLGYQTYFRYEKYRTEFGGSNGGTVTFDETPIGNFLELEGPGPWIDETAVRLGFGASDYVLASYGKLYLSHCENEGVQPSNMLFPSSFQNT